MDYLSGLAQEINFTSPNGLTFPSTAVGSSSISPRTFNLTNDGNALLTFPVPGTGSNPNVSAGFTFNNSTWQ